LFGSFSLKITYFEVIRGAHLKCDTVYFSIKYTYKIDKFYQFTSQLHVLIRTTNSCCITRIKLTYIIKHL